MRRVVRSRGYVLARVATGALFIVLGAAIILRTLGTLGFDAREIPALALGGALVALGLLRLRAYRSLERTAP